MGRLCTDFHGLVRPKIDGPRRLVTTIIRDKSYWFLEYIVAIKLERLSTCVNATNDQQIGLVLMGNCEL